MSMSVLCLQNIKKQRGENRSTNKKENIKPDEAQTRLELKVEVNKGILRKDLKDCIHSAV